MTARKLGLLVSIISFFANAKLSFAALNQVQETDGFAGLEQLTVVFANVASIASSLIGFSVLIMFIRGGVGYITAQGDPKALASARSTMTWAVVGFFVVIASYLIISFIAGFFALPGIGRFCFPGNTDCPTS